VPSEWEYNQLPNSLMVTLFVTLAAGVGLYAGYDAAITPVVRTRWVWPLTIRQLATTGAVALGVGIAAGAITAATVGPAETIPVGAIFAFGMTGTVIAVRGLLLAREDAAAPNLEWHPWRVLATGLRYGAVAGFLGGALVGAYIGLIASPLAGLLNIIEIGPASAVMLAALNGIRSGGRVMVQHAILRILLAATGHGPLRYRGFLEDAANRRLMLRIERGYMPPHGLIIDHLAANRRL
jgi:hypothetical protein